jgi:hypothetical protein
MPEEPTMNRSPRHVVSRLSTALVLALAVAGTNVAALAQPQNATAVAAATAPQATQTTQTTRYDTARDEYEVGHFDAAFAAFAQLADEGHCEAARVAQQMVRYGRMLYATEFTVAPARLARWRAHTGCPTALAAR